MNPIEENVIKPGDIDSLNIIPKSEYRAKLRMYLPEDCFNSNNKHVFFYFVFMAAYLTLMYFTLNISFIPARIFLSLVMGITLTSLSFFLHDLFHGSIIRSKYLAYAVGLTIGIFNLFSPLFWKRVHNFHHARTGNIDDPDRSYILNDRPKSWFEKIVYKTRISNESFNPLLSMILIPFGFFFYFGNAMIGGLIVNHKGHNEDDVKYSRIHELFKKPHEKLAVVLEVLTLFSFQVFLFTVIAKGSFFTYLLIAIIPFLMAHTITMLYIHTNHFLSPLTGEIDDPLLNSLSIKDCWLVDKIFSNFSHHVEHHLFPAMSSVHYPKVRKLLLEHYGDRYKMMTMYEAVKMLFKTPRIYATYTSFITTDGKKQISCLKPTTI